MTPLRNGLLLVLAGIALGGCGTSPPIHYYALNAQAPSQASGDAKLLTEILPVAIPQRLNREEMVLTDGTGQLDVRGTDHWAAPLADEVRQLLSDALWERLRSADSYQAPVAASPGGLPQYRLALRIERFEAVPGQGALVQGSWTARRLPQGKSVTCRASITIPLAGLTPAAAAAALSAGASQLTGLVADSIGRLDHDAPACPPDTV